MKLLDSVKFDEKGLVSAIAQDFSTGEVLMLAYMNRETLSETLEKGVMVYFSRSRQKRWFKGETSGMFKKCVKCMSTAMVTPCFLKSNRQAQPVMKTTTVAFFAEETTISGESCDKDRRVMLR
jgi:phosphoribosyl-AMP cyclohydrolase